MVAAYEREFTLGTYDLFLIDMSVPGPTQEDLLALGGDPEPLVAALRSWAVCTAVYESWGDYTTHEYYSDDGPTLERFGTTYGIVTVDRTALCVPPLGHQVIVGHLSTAWRVVQPDPLVTISFIGFFPLYFDEEIELWARYSLVPSYYPVAGKAHLLARELAGLTSPETGLDQGEPPSGSVAGGSLCSEAFHQCKTAAGDIWLAAVDSCQATVLDGSIRMLTTCSLATLFLLELGPVVAWVGGFICLVGEAAAVHIKGNTCISGARSSYSAAIRSCYAGYLTCCAGSDDCPPTLARE
jgi:hypothetical protein